MTPTRRFWGRSVEWALILAAAGTFAPAVAHAQLTPAEMGRITEEIAEAGRLQSQGKNEQAIQILEKTLTRVSPEIAPTDPTIGVLKTSLGSLYGFANQFKKAEAMLREAIAVADAQPDRGVAFRFKATDGLVQMLQVQSRQNEALPICEQALKAAETLLGPEDPQTAMTRQILANLYLFTKRPDAALPLGRRALAWAEARHGAEDPQTIHSRNTVAMALLHSGQPREALPLFEASVKIARKRLPPGDQFRTTALSGLAACYQSLGRDKEAQEIANEAGGGALSRPDANPHQVVEALNIKAVTAMSRGQHAEAEQCYKEALKIAQEKLGVDHTGTGSILTNLSQLYIRMGRYAEAESLVRDSLSVLEKRSGPRTVATAMALNNLASVYHSTARYDECLPLLERARAILEHELEPGHPQIASIRHNLAMFYSETGQDQKAVELIEQSLANVERRLGPEHPAVGTILVNLGASYASLIQYGKAEAAFRRASAIFQKIEPGSDDAASADRALSEFCRLRGNFSEAESLARRSIDAFTARLGSEHPSTTTALDNLAALLAAQGRTAEAAEVTDAARRSRRSFLLKTLPAYPEDDQMTLITSGERSSLDSALTLAIERHSEPGVAAKSAEWVLNSKALTATAMARRGTLTRAARSPATASIATELDSVRNRLATLAFARPGIEEAGTAPSGEDYKSLEARERELSRQLGLTFGQPEDVDRWVGLSEVRAKLPADAVLVEFARVRLSVFATKEIFKKGLAGPQYVAWVIPAAGRGEVKLIDLGAAAPIERAVSEANRLLQPDPARPILPGDEAGAEKQALAALGAVGELLIKRLGPELETTHRWVISPDSALWLVPWSALPIGEGRYAVERHLIHLAISGRDLLTASEATEATPPAIFADPDYDLAPAQVVATASKALGGTASTAPPTAFATARDAFTFEHFERLPGTRKEAGTIGPLMATYAGRDPLVFVDGSASETVFKGLRGPRAVVLSTHGFFVASPEPVDDPQSPFAGVIPPRRPRATIQNPLLRCGLILAGCNNRAKTPSIAQADDGVLTGLEIASADLRGTELAVLSACRTGLGDVRVGEGVAGLRQAFQVAGVRGVVASLWSVQDLESFQLMSAFFYGLAARRGPATSLRDAQLALIADRRSRLKSAHPTFWAAFTLTGFPGASWQDETLAEIGSPNLPPIPKLIPDIDLADASKMVSPVTGLPEAGNPWVDSTIVVVLLAAGGWAARWWWRFGAPGRS